MRGIKVLDLTSVVMGPWATQIFGDLGAEVITVEGPGRSTNRSLGPGQHPELHDVALNLLRNKRSVVIDLSTPAGRRHFLDLVSDADVLVTNLLPNVRARFHISFEEVQSINPKLIYCQAQGWSTESGNSDRPAYDDVIQAASGVVDAVGRASGAAGFVPTVVADKVASLTIVYAVLAALLERTSSGRGQRIEVPMLDCLTSFLLVEHAAGRITSDKADAGYARVLATGRGPQQTRDGLVCVLPYSAQNYVDLYAAVGRNDSPSPDQIQASRGDMACAEALYAQLKDVVRILTTAEWLEVCQRYAIPCSPVVSLETIIDRLPVATHPHAGRYHVTPSPVSFSRSTVDPLRRPAPLKGEHTADILGEP